jgi:hypothetical protein
MTGYFAQPPLRVRPDATVEANAGNATLTVANTGKIETNTGAAGAITLTLPAVAAAAGTGLKVQVTAAQVVNVAPGAATEKIFLGGDGVANKNLIIAGVVGNYADLYCDGMSWMVTAYSGVLTKQP